MFLESRLAVLFSKVCGQRNRKQILKIKMWRNEKIIAGKRNREINMKTRKS